MIESYTETKYFLICDKCEEELDFVEEDEQSVFDMAIISGWTNPSCDHYDKWFCDKCSK